MVDAVAAAQPSTTPMSRQTGEVPKALSAQIPSPTNTPTVQAIVVPSAANAATPGRSREGVSGSGSGVVNRGSVAGCHRVCLGFTKRLIGRQTRRKLLHLPAEPPLDELATGTGGTLGAALRLRPGWNHV